VCYSFGRYVKKAEPQQRPRCRALPRVVMPTPTNASTLVGLLYVFRHGQRSPYPPPKADNWTSAAAAGWTSRPEGFPAMTAAAWNMSSAAFNNNELTENGRALLRHMGEHVAITAAPLTHVAATSAPLAQGTDTCTLQALLVADDSTRDEQSAASFASGFFPPSCAHARREAIVVANETNGLRAATSDSDTALCDEPVNEATLEERFGSTAFLTDLYQPQSACARDRHPRATPPSAPSVSRDGGRPAAASEPRSALFSQFAE
jgi:hypothetical protein